MADYFSTGDSGASDGAAPSWYALDEIAPVELVEGLRFQPVLGEGALVNFVTYEPNVVVPLHSHDEEQFAFVLEGELEFECGGDTRTLRRGDVVHVPPGVPHAARTRGAPCVQVDVFAPPRQALLDALRAASDQ